MFFLGKAGRAGLLSADKCIQGTKTPLQSAPTKSSAHIIKKTPLVGPFYKDPKDPSKGEFWYAMFGMGCFWCSENLFMRMKGVYSTQVGYAGGVTLNPSYEDVCTGRTNHNEVVRVIYDEDVISYRDLLKVFWTGHDPTTFFQQGNDRGSQYRSGIYYYNAEQQKIAEDTKDIYQRDIKNEFGSKEISTEIVEAPIFYYAEEDHQQYDARGMRQYCGLRPLGVKASL